MKGLFKKLLVVSVLVISLLACGCTYRKEGSVCQDIKMTLSYGDEQVDSVITLYKTFAEKNSQRFIDLVKDGYFNNTAVVFSKTGSYLELGTYEYKDNTLSVKDNSKYSTVEGEFKENGQTSRLTVSAGSVLMLRIPDDVSEKAKYNTAKTSFVIVLSNSGEFSAEKYTVIGKIDAEAVDALNDLKNGTDDITSIYQSEDDYVQYLLKERDENGFEKGSSKTIYSKDNEYYEKSGDDFVKVELNNDNEYDDGTIAREVNDAKAFNIVVIPTKQFTISSIKLVNKQ